MTVAANYVCSEVGHVAHAGSGESITELSVTGIGEDGAMICHQQCELHLKPAV